MHVYFTKTEGMEHSPYMYGVCRDHYIFTMIDEKLGLAWYCFEADWEGLNNDIEIFEAYKAACYVRFEFGETPRGTK